MSKSGQWFFETQQDDEIGALCEPSQEQQNETTEVENDSNS